MNGVETYIKNKFDALETTWFPLQRCLSMVKKQRKLKTNEDDMQDLDQMLKAKIAMTEENLANLESVLN